MIVLKGRIFTGLSEGKLFIELPWVRKQIKDRFGFEPYLGTLNIALSANNEIDSLLDKSKGWSLKPEKGYFSGRFYKAIIMNQVRGAVIIPETPNYPNNIVEIVAPLRLRDKYNLEDGDEIYIKILLK